MLLNRRSSLQFCISIPCPHQTNNISVVIQFLLSLVLGLLNANAQLRDFISQFTQKNTTDFRIDGWGLGERNNKGERLIQYCEQNNLLIANTWFKLPSRQLYTWKSPQENDHHIVRNQINCITISRRFRNSISRVITMLGAHIVSDHNPVCTNIVSRLAKPKKKIVSGRHWTYN